MHWGWAVQAGGTDPLSWTEQLHEVRLNQGIMHRQLCLDEIKVAAGSMLHGLLLLLLCQMWGYMAQTVSQKQGPDKTASHVQFSGRL